MYNLTRPSERGELGPSTSLDMVANSWDVVQEFTSAVDDSRLLIHVQVRAFIGTYIFFFCDLNSDSFYLYCVENKYLTG